MRLLFVLALLLSACTTANLGPGAAENQTQTVEVTAAPDAAAR